MSGLAFIAAVVLLPLFPFSMIAVSLFERIGDDRVRAVILGLWMLPGAVILDRIGEAPPDWLLVWAMLTALFYAWRAVALQDARVWLAFLAISSAALVWTSSGNSATWVALAFGLPLSLMSLLIDLVERRYGAAHAAIDLRLATQAPKLAGLIVVGLLAVMALPVSPSFFAFLTLTLAQAQISVPTVLAISGCWILWSWSGARMLAGLVIGPAAGPVNDIPEHTFLKYAAVIVIVGLSGLLYGGMRL